MQGEKITQVAVITFKIFQNQSILFCAPHSKDFHLIDKLLGTVKVTTEVPH